MVARSLPESPGADDAAASTDSAPVPASKTPPAPVTVRAARTDDVVALLALEALFPGDRLSPRQMRAHVANPRARLRVLRIGREIAGYALIFLRGGSELARLYSIVVDPARRGHGLGIRLLHDAERQARLAGAARLRLEVRADNAAAIALYAGRGYRRIARLASYYEDGGDGWRYEKRLQ
jgi:ribosomal-protein-alanine N-acetyltransferase